MRIEYAVGGEYVKWFNNKGSASVKDAPPLRS